METIKLVIFDWNGTIISDTKEILKGANAVFNFLNAPELSFERFQEIVDVPISEYSKKNGVDPEQFDIHKEKISKIFSSTYEPLAEKLSPRIGTIEMLTFLKEKSIDTFIVSNHPVKEVERLVNQFGLSDYFEETIGADNQKIVYSHRGKKEKVMDLIKRKNVLPSETIIVGDTGEEIEIARELGLLSIAITDGFWNRKRLIEAGPDFLIDNIGEIISIIENR